MSWGKWIQWFYKLMVYLKVVLKKQNPKGSFRDPAVEDAPADPFWSPGSFAWARPWCSFSFQSGPALGELLAIFNAKRQPLYPTWTLLCQFLWVVSQLKLFCFFFFPVSRTPADLWKRCSIISLDKREALLQGPMSFSSKQMEEDCSMELHLGWQVSLIFYKLYFRPYEVLPSVCPLLQTHL